MTHLGYIAGAYVLSIAVPALLALSAARRLTLARRRLAAIDPRGRR